MKQYIGTKIIQAEPANRFWFENGEKLVVPDSEDTPNRVREATAGEKGYKVVYPPDGYESWSPKDVFEAAYRATDGMNFGLAIEAAKMGKRIARAGWNGKNQYVELACGISYLPWPVDCNEVVNVNHDDIGSMAFAFVGTSGVQMGWLASQADMLANDWKIVE